MLAWLTTRSRFHRNRRRMAEDEPPFAARHLYFESSSLATDKKQDEHDHNNEA